MYQVRFSKSAIKELEKLDQSVSKMIKHWIIKNLVGSTNPRLHGKALTGNLKGIWRYRVENYRLFAEIHDNEMIIHLIDVLHRKNAY